MAVQRISVLNVPVDIIQPEEIETELLALLDKPGAKQIIFLSIWDLLYARLNTEYLVCLEKADLVLPISKSILSGARFLKQKIPVRYNPFSAIISILAVLNKHYKSLYLFGTHKPSLMQAESNVRATFTGIQIVGRCVGYYNKMDEKNIIAAIFKASPAVVLLGSGIKNPERWVYRRRNCFNSSVFIADNDVLDIFSKRKKYVNPKTFEKGLEIWPEIVRNPLKIFLIFPFMWYRFLLVIYRLFKKNKSFE
ncbi:MAG: WecB/TagA/CpsF family glycosyltransferase [Treponemataceae bacterium]|nr:WecB/TagA/CpsF family glycosyltransferase [Treponemataceae bacterium]